MFCGKCGAQLREGDKFCGKCRAPISAAHPAASPNPPNAVPQGTASPAEETGTPRPPRRRNWWKAAAAVAILVFLAVIGVLYQRSRAKTPTLVPAGPVVEMPPAIVFRGATGINSSTRAGLSEQVGAVSQARVARAQREAALHPNDPKTLNDAGVVIAAAGDSERGTALLEQAHQAAPQDPTIAYNYARALYQQGKTDDAIKMAQTAVQHQPQFDNAHLLMAAAAVQKQDYATAQQQLKQVQNLMQEVALLIQGVIQLKNHQPQQALATFQQAVQVASGDPAALYDEGLGYQMNQNLGHAQQLYQAAINLNPGLAEAHHNLGTVYTQMGKPEEAFQQYHAAAWQDPTNITFTHDLARSTRAAGASPDRIVGTWLLNGGTIRLSATTAGRQHALSIPVRPGERITITKVGARSWRFTESDAASRDSTTFQLQRDGSYSAPTVNTPEEARLQRQYGFTERGLVTIWVRGDIMFGDTTTIVTGQNISGNSRRTWKATRAASK